MAAAVGGLILLGMTPFIAPLAIYLPKAADTAVIIAAFRKERPALEPIPPGHPAPSLARAEWEHIHRVLSDCGGNISEAARRLGIHRRSLQRKLQKYAPD